MNNAERLVPGANAVSSLRIIGRIDPGRGAPTNRLTPAFVRGRGLRGTSGLSPYRSLRSALLDRPSRGGGGDGSTPDRASRAARQRRSPSVESSPPARGRTGSRRGQCDRGGRSSPTARLDGCRSATGSSSGGSPAMAAAAVSFADRFSRKQWPAPQPHRPQIPPQPESPESPVRPASSPSRR